MRRDKASRLVNFALLELRRIAPVNADCKVDVKENGNGLWLAQLKVIANHKVYFAKKEGQSMNEGFHKAMKAIKNQLIKEKKNLKAHEPLKYIAA